MSEMVHAAVAGDVREAEEIRRKAEAATAAAMAKEGRKVAPAAAEDTPISDDDLDMDEVKKEYKEQEGDPHVKSPRKALHRAMLHENMAQSVPKATAVVVNPTHLAIALR